MHFCRQVCTIPERQGERQGAQILIVLAEPLAWQFDGVTK